MQQTSAGIDYGRGQTNIDTSNGIRYGVVSMHDISQAWADSSEGYYGEPTCPTCGNAVDDANGFNDDDGEYEQSGHDCADYVCHSCKVTLDSGDVFSDEALGYSYDDDGYRMESCLDSDVMILKSPFYTFARFCSPCAPGAGDLNSADDRDSSNGVKTYCVNHDWFDDGKAPYRVFKVDDDSEVLPDVD